MIPSCRCSSGKNQSIGHADEDTGKGAEHPLHQTTAGGAVTSAGRRTIR